MKFLLKEEESFTYFETSKGSKYIINKNNQLRRWKSHHQNTGGEDMGLHSWSDFAMFIEPSFYDSASAFEQLSTNKGFKVGISKDAEGKMFYMIFDDGEWRPAKWKDAYPKYVADKPDLENKVLSWKYTKTPTLGFHVIDVNFKSNNSTQLSSFHIANTVSRIEETIPDEEKKLFFKSDKNLQEQTNRIKQMMGLLKEEIN